MKFLEDGKVDAVAVMEPWITVATKLGYRIICEAFYDGAEVADPSVEPEAFEAVNRALNKAVAKLASGDGVKPYLKYMMREVPEDICKLTEDDFYLPRFRYLEVPRPYSPEEYGQIQDWMVDWGLLETESVYDKIVEERKIA
jgi:NitT/TauT family transport system substrate-binding protein